MGGVGDVPNLGSAREGWRGSTVRVDWLQGSMRPELEGELWKHRWPVGEVKETRQLWGRHYPRCFEDELGLLFGLKTKWEGAREQVDRIMGCWNGTALGRRREKGCDDRELLVTLRDWGFDVTRIDLACDVPSSLVTPELARDLDARDWVVTKLSNVGWRSNSNDGGSTFYRQSSDKTVVLRVYNKTAERSRHGQLLLAEDGSAITRIELQLRGSHAKHATQHLMRLTTDADAWHSGLAKLVTGLILRKWRPLAAQAPERNSQRVPTHDAFVRALGECAPVTYAQGVFEYESDQAYKLRGHVDNLKRFAGSFTTIHQAVPGFADELAKYGAAKLKVELRETVEHFASRPAVAAAIVRSQLALPFAPPTAEVEA
jgi:hypothetical protein